MTATTVQDDNCDFAVVSLHHAKSGDALPVSHYINADGTVRRQDYWAGKPSRLAGFLCNVTSASLALTHEAFWRNPDAAIGMYAAFLCADGSRLKMPVPVARITTHAKPGA
ncbi:hypothetical protein PV646_28465 [Streptomyces sp. ID05-26A]|nr:hypothetical protein [Streptomyces sp. ID05-26A]